MLSKWVVVSKPKLVQVKGNNQGVTQFYPRLRDGLKKEVILFSKRKGIVCISKDCLVLNHFPSGLRKRYKLIFFPNHWGDFVLIEALLQGPKKEAAEVSKNTAKGLYGMDI